VTELQVTACVFGSPYAFHLIAEGPMVCPFSEFLYDSPFCNLQGFEVTHSISFKTLGHAPSFDVLTAHVQ